MLKKVVIVGAKRTPIGSFMGTLKDIPATELGIKASQAAISQAHEEDSPINFSNIGEVYYGSALQAGLG